MKTIDRVRIEAKSSHVTEISGVVPDLFDTRIVGITRDGEEIEITAVSEVRWSVKCDNEPARAEIVILGAEIDAVGAARVIEEIDQLRRDRDEVADQLLRARAELSALKRTLGE